MIKLISGAALALLLTAAPLAADPVKPAPGTVPMAGMSDDQVVDCMFRLVRLSNTASDAVKDPATTADKRKTADTLEDQAARGVSFYMGYIYSKPWVANRMEQSTRIFTAQGSENAAVSADRTTACLTRAMDAQANIFAAALGK